MTYLSVCSGIEAVSIAWKPLGFRPIGFSEIESFPCELLKQKYPDVKNYGDITQYEKWNAGQFDILVGGTPCQSFSIAGKRGGTADERGALMYAYLGIVEIYRPRWVIWENVPGVLSSNSGYDFASFLAGLEECGYGWAYRVLDAQYFGVPQRRRRVFVVGHIDNRTDLAAEVLFEPESLCGDIAAGSETQKEATGNVGESAKYTVYLAHPSASRYTEANNTIDTVTARYGTGGGNTPLVLKRCILVSEKETTGTLLVRCGKHLWQNNQEVFSRDFLVVNGRQNPVVSKNRAGTLDTDGRTNTVCYTEKTNTQCCIRRLTPLECERLQGFPDNWTQIEWHGKPAEQCPDSLRYKAIGNSMAVPAMRWIGERIKRIKG